MHTCETHVSRLMQAPPDQSQPGVRARTYRATISGSVQVRTCGCVVASPLLYNSSVNQVYEG
ncbi:MAG: hypothetical protein ABI456_18520, partial [Ktedonobacteraceae bacterium]